MATMTALSTVTVGAGGVATIDFTNIPQTYTDLVLKISARYVQSGSGTLVEVTFNNSSTSYTNRRLLGTGSAASSNSSGTAYINVLPASEGGWTANTFGNGELYIPNYTSANNKSVSADYVTENNATLALSGLTAGLWSNTSAITSIKLTGETGSSLTFAQYTTATLYGVWKGPETLPSTPTIGTATATGATTATVAFTPTSATNVDASFTALSSPGSITATGTSSPITVSGLTTGTAYTFQVRANNPGGSSAYSAASNSVTPDIPGAFESIATVNLSSNQSTITFSSIPQTYKHLQLRITGRTTVAGNAAEMALKVNGDSGIYTRHLLFGDGSSIGIDGRAQGDDAFFMSWIAGNNAAANIQGVCIVDILDYTTSKTKAISVLTGLDRNGAGLVGIESSQINSGSAVSSISLITQPSGLNFMANSSFALYGIQG